MKFKKIVSVLLAICCLGSVAACGETSGYAKAGAPDYSEASGEIVLDSWLAPRASEQAMAEYAECGYNMMHLGNDSIMPETGGGINGNSLSASAKQKMNDDLDRYLTLGEKYGVKAILSMNARNMNQTDYMDFSYMDKIISPTLEKWKDKDTFYGYMPLDEPRFLDLPITVKQTATGGERAYSKIIDWANDDYTYFASKYPNKKYEIVLLGITNNQQAIGQSFEDGWEMFDFYCENFAKNLPRSERIISYDAYPFSADSRTGEIYNRGGFMASLEYGAIKARELGGENWTYTQAHNYITNPQQITYQYYTAMAYGVTHFVTYCYMGEVWKNLQYLMSDAGEKTDLWYYYQSANNDIKKMEKIYLQFAKNWKGALAIEGSQRLEGSSAMSKIKYALNGYDGIKSVKATQDTVIGIMQDKNGYDGYMITNQVIATGNTRDKVDVTFDGATKALVFRSGADEPETVSLDKGALGLDIPSGGAAFVIPYKEA